MLVGHVAVGLAGKRFAPGISFGTLVMAALAADLFWCLFLMAGIEHVQIVERGSTLMTSEVLFQIPYSHSLVMDAVWAVLFAAACFFLRRDGRGTLLVFAAVISHWVLDFVSHKPDMPLAPGSAHLLGLGLWASIPGTLLVEGGLWLLAILWYARATRSQSRVGSFIFWAGIVILTLAWYNNIAGPPPPSAAFASGISSLIFFVLITGWAYWINRLRPLKETIR